MDLGTWRPPVTTIVLYAKDPDASVEFYVNALSGHDMGNSLGFTSERLVQVQGTVLAFRPKDRQDVAWPGGLRGTNGDLASKPMAIHLRFTVEDVLGAYQVCLQSGAREAKSKPFAMGMTMYAEIRTRDGHLIELIGPVSPSHPAYATAKRKADKDARIERIMDGRGLPGESILDD